MRKLCPGVLRSLAFVAFAAMAGFAAPAAAEPAHTLDLAVLDTSGGSLRRVHGSDGVGSRGVPVAGGFDCNFDGNLDYGFSAMLADPAGRTDAGEAYLILGDGTISGTLETAASHPDILHIQGAAESENTGTEVWMGDVTGDGIGDSTPTNRKFFVFPVGIVVFEHFALVASGDHDETAVFARDLLERGPDADNVVGRADSGCG